MKTERLRVADRVLDIHPDHSQAPGGGGRLADLAVWLEAPLLARTLRSGPWLYPLVNLAHVLGILALARTTLPVAGAGLASTLITGPALLAVRATEYAAKPFPLGEAQRRRRDPGQPWRVARGEAWRSGGEAPRSRRRLALAGAVSLAAWLAAVSAGRMIAYW